MTSAEVQAMADQRRGRLLAVLYANSQPRVGSYIALAKAIQSVGHLAVVVIPDSVHLEVDELAGFESVLFSKMAEAEILELRGVDVFISSEVVHDVAPPGSVTVCVPHSIPDAGLQTQRLAGNAARFIEINPTVIRTFDYIAVAVRQRPAHWTIENYAFLRNFYPAKFLVHRRPFIDIIPAGYPKLDYSRAILSSAEPKDCILYTPTASHVPLGRLRHDGEVIVRSLVEAFPTMRIVLRPYPSAEDLQFGRVLAESFTRSANVIFDNSATGIAFQRRAALAVTDSSSSAITFSIATGRPLIFASVKPGAGDAPQRILFGYSANSVAALIQAARDCQNGSEAWHRTISREAEQNLYNPGHAAAYLADRLELIAKRKSHPEWLSIERQPWVPCGREGEAAEHLTMLATWRKRAPSKRADQAYEEIAQHLQAVHAEQPPSPQYPVEPIDAVHSSLKIHGESSSSKPEVVEPRQTNFASVVFEHTGQFTKRGHNEWVLAHDAAAKQQLLIASFRALVTRDHRYVGMLLLDSDKHLKITATLGGLGSVLYDSSSKTVEITPARPRLIVVSHNFRAEHRGASIQIEVNNCAADQARIRISACLLMPRMQDTAAQRKAAGGVFAQATQLFAQERYAESIPFFIAAAHHSSVPSLNFNVLLALRRLGIEDETMIRTLLRCAS
jgi:hypothetical protein